MSRTDSPDPFPFNTQTACAWTYSLTCSEQTNERLPSRSEEHRLIGRDALRTKCIQNERHGPTHKKSCRPSESAGSFSIKHRYSPTAAIPPTTALNPLSTWVISAVIPEARSESKNAAAFPTCSIVTLRRKGALFSTKSRILPKPLIPLAARVLIGPAEMPLT